jgi:putative membrane protein
MRNFLLRLFINAFSLTVVAMILPGIHFSDNSLVTLALVALILGLVNAILKPLIFILSCPLIIFTLGLWALVINGIVLLITDELAGSRFEIDSFWWAVLAGLIIGFIGGVMENALGLNDRKKDDDDQIQFLSQ